jgi:hypothetical protein
VIRFEDRTHAAVTEEAHQAVLAANKVSLLHLDRVSLPFDASRCAVLPGGLELPGVRGASVKRFER